MRNRFLCLFLSTPSARRATETNKAFNKAVLEFLSTPSARRATLPAAAARPFHQDFYPRPPRGGRRGGVTIDGAAISIHALREEGDELRDAPAANAGISIHALREEGDVSHIPRINTGSNFYPRPPRGGRLCKLFLTPPAFQFLSTPSARRATIHDLAKIKDKSDFYPRPPRGGRP